jgi:hypothetical protein
MAQDKHQNNREGRLSHPPSSNKPEGNSRRQTERNRIDIFQVNGSNNHRVRTEREILWDNDLYERQSI